jgi:hypothetical protein
MLRYSNLRKKRRLKKRRQTTIRIRSILYICRYYCSRSSMDRIMVSGTIDMSSNLVGSTEKPLIFILRGFLIFVVGLF